MSQALNLTCAHCGESINQIWQVNGFESFTFETGGRLYSAGFHGICGNGCGYTVVTHNPVLSPQCLTTGITVLHIPPKGFSAWV
ncbi:hypothetical protein KKF32_01630 [Patescibacteria group bacterium]|nr:hypothetical protein [Patescibacteria group bacterium]